MTFLSSKYRGRCGRDRIQLHVQSVSITIYVVSSNSAHVEVHSIQHYVISVSVTGR
jgi:hypothetical protein